MPSRTEQDVKIIKLKKKNTGNSKYIVIARRTGFMDLWIEGRHFYYNYVGGSDNFSALNIEDIVRQFQEQQNRKKVIVIRRK